MAPRQREEAPPDDDAPATPAPQPMITVAAVARRLGVAASTLRTWDRRYGLGPSGHTAGSHRRYSAADLGRLMVMRRLTVEGVPPAEAAQIALSPEAAEEGRLASVTTLRGGEFPNPAGWLPEQFGSDQPEPGAEPALPVPEDRAGAERSPASLSAAERLSLDFDDLAAALRPPAAGTPEPDETDEPEPARGSDPGADDWGPSGSWRPRPATRRAIAMPDGGPAAAELARAALALDTPDCARLLREAIRDHGVQQMWEGTALPVLQYLGDRWRTAGDCQEVEHALTETLLGVLRGVAAGLHRPRNPRPVLLACAEGEIHTLPSHVLAAALSQEDVGTRNLGLGLPGEAVLGAVRRCGPGVVFVYARLTVADPSFLADLLRAGDGPRVLVGGRGWDPGALPRSVRWVGSLGESIDEIVAAAEMG